MKNRFFITTFAGILCLAIFAVAAAQDKNFSGTWRLEAAKSEGLPPGMNQEMKVSQNGDEVKIETKVITEKGEQTVPDSYNLNNQAMDFEPTFPGGVKGKGKRTAKRTENGFEVVEKSSVDTPEGAVTIEMKRKWQLAADGKSLIIEMEVKGPQGEQKTKRTFIKV